MLKTKFFNLNISIQTSQCQTSAITALRFSNEESLLASGSRSGAIKICDLESQKGKRRSLTLKINVLYTVRL